MNLALAYMLNLDVVKSESFAFSGHIFKKSVEQNVQGNGWKSNGRMHTRTVL